MRGVPYAGLVPANAASAARVTPVYAVGAKPAFLTHLFVFPGQRCYFYGDYYGDSFAATGFTPWYMLSGYEDVAGTYDYFNWKYARRGTSFIDKMSRYDALYRSQHFVTSKNLAGSSYLLSDPRLSQVQTFEQLLTHFDSTASPSVVTNSTPQRLQPERAAVINTAPFPSPVNQFDTMRREVERAFQQQAAERMELTRRYREDMLRRNSRLFPPTQLYPPASPLGARRISPTPPSRFPFPTPPGVTARNRSPLTTAPQTLAPSNPSLGGRGRSLGGTNGADLSRGPFGRSNRERSGLFRRR